MIKNIISKYLAVFSFFLLLSHHSFSKLQILGELPAKPQLFEKLLNFDWSKNDDLRSKEEKFFYKSNIEWIKSVYKYILNPTTSKCKAIAKANCARCIQNSEMICQEEFASYFDLIDSRNILVPILKTLYNFDLTESNIHRIFLKNHTNYDVEKRTYADDSFFYNDETKQSLYQCAERILQIVMPSATDCRD